MRRRRPWRSCIRRCQSRRASSNRSFSGRRQHSWQRRRCCGGPVSIAALTATTDFEKRHSLGAAAQGKTPMASVCRGRWPRKRSPLSEAPRIQGASTCGVLCMQTRASHAFVLEALRPNGSIAAPSRWERGQCCHRGRYTSSLASLHWWRHCPQPSLPGTVHGEGSSRVEQWRTNNLLGAQRGCLRNASAVFLCVLQHILD